MSDKDSTRSDETSSHWESVYSESPLESLPWEEGKPSSELVSLIESGEVEKGAVLDVCCGSASNAIYLAGEGLKCYGLDISSKAIKYGREKANKAGITCELTVGNALEPPYPDNFFNLIFDRGCFHSISPGDRRTFIKGIHRVLRPTGKYQMLCFSKKDHRYGPPYPFSTQDIKRYFSKMFRIRWIREISTMTGRYFLSVLMDK